MGKHFQIFHIVVSMNSSIMMMFVVADFIVDIITIIIRIIFFWL